MSTHPLGARKDKKWHAIGIEPSITKTPIGPIQVPIPYQVISDLSQSTATSDSVYFNGQPAYLLDQSKMPKCMGDEQGTSGGTRSGTTSMEVIPSSGSGSTRIHGKKPIRHGDLCTLNKGNCKGKFIASGGAAVSGETPAAKTVRVHILPRNPVAQAGNVVPLDVIATPSGGQYHWRIKGHARLIDRSGRPCKEGKEVFIQGNPRSENGPFLEITVYLKYQHSNGAATTQTTLFVPPASLTAAPQAITLQSLAILADDEKQWTTGGFRVMGTDGGRYEDIGKKKRDITIACFLDGTANSQVSRTNIFLMFDAVRRHEGKWPHNAIVDAGYLSGPGAAVADYAGCILGTGSRQIAERAYKSIVAQCLGYLNEEGILPHIDIYGFSRGAAIANELAWMIYDRGIKDGDDPPVVAPRQVPVRFLGLFDTVHSMDQPGRDTSGQWHNTTIAPAVQHCAHALAADEQRVYFLPSFVQRIKGTGEDVEELIFPGVHSDVGGSSGYNKDLMKLTRSWMAEQAMRAGAIYLEAQIISGAERRAILNDPKKRKPSPEGQAWIKPNVVYWEEKRREAANRFWGYDSNGQSPGLPQAIAKASINSVYPWTQVIIPGSQNLIQQPVEMHMPRVFPKRIARILDRTIDTEQGKK